MRLRAGEAATGYALRVIPRAIKPVPEEANETDQDLHLSTADDLKVGFHPWLNIRSARWLRFESAPTLRLQMSGSPSGFCCAGWDASEFIVDAK